MDSGVKGLAILGSTGSIGRQTLDVVRAFPDRFSVVALSAGRNLELLAEQAREFGARVASSEASVDELAAALPPGCAPATHEEVATHPDVSLVMAASVGSAGLGPIMAAIRAGKTLALANKEPVVMAGEVVMRAAREMGVDVLPVDSEPSAIWQCLRGQDRAISRVIITASGGAFRARAPEELASVTPEEALRHPTWTMGRKITIDSATLMNKGFEVIESRWLFDLPWERIDVVVHHQSIIHAMVEFEDGSTMAQLSPPDMRIPIQHALLYPERMENDALPRFRPAETGALTFEPLDEAKYPCFRLAVEAGRKGMTYPAALSAADEVAVEMFLGGAIGFTDIPAVVEWTLSRHDPAPAPALEDILAADEWARRTALSWSGRA